LRGLSEIRPRVCATVVEGDVAKMVEVAFEAAAKGADLVELRLDMLPTLARRDIELVFRGLAPLSLPKIATVMPASTLGKYAGSEGKRGSLLLDAAVFADYVDLGIEMGEENIERCLSGLDGKKAEPIISWHSETPLSEEEIKGFVDTQPKGTICKAVMRASSQRDNLVALNACAGLEGRRRIVFCYGEKGVLSRVASPLFGSEWTYASVAKGKEGAPGQLDVIAMRSIYEVLGI